MTEHPPDLDMERMIRDGEISLAIDIMVGLSNCIKAIESKQKQFLYGGIMYDLETGFNKIQEEHNAIHRSGVLEGYHHERIFELYEATTQEVRKLLGGRH